MKDFFISYNKADKGWAEWIAWQLEAAGQRVTLQAWDFRQGGNYVLDMQRAVNESRRTLIVLSPDFLASQYAAPEWAAAFALDPTGAQGRLLPVRVRECQPTGLLAQIVYIDLVGLKDGKQARQRLLQGATQGRTKPHGEPDMPPLEVATTPPAAIADEPPWPPALEVASSVVGRIFWRVLRFAALAIGAGLAVQALLTRSLPHWAANSPGAVMTAALLWGLLCALAVEALVRLLQRRGIRRQSNRGPS
jgi:hypothetical protein